MIPTETLDLGEALVKGDPWQRRLWHTGLVSLDQRAASPDPPAGNAPNVL